MTTLTDFLLARIAEDEEAANAALGTVVFGGVFSSGPVIPPTRVLAECEAKRLIVEKAKRADAAFAQQINPATSAASFAMIEVLTLLALPFADHPDYDESWKP